MKAGRASTFANRILGREARDQHAEFQTWKDFEKAFAQEFYPQHEAEMALNRLESRAYHQGARSVQEYIDEFRELIEEAGYTQGLVIVMKFRRGLQLRIQDRIAEMGKDRPRDDDPEHWYRMARLLDENYKTNQAFRDAQGWTQPSFTTTPNPSPTHPNHPGPTRGAGTRIPPTCFGCGQTGHLRKDCLRGAEVRQLTTGEPSEDTHQQTLETEDLEDLKQMEGE
jgi:hypothetical protein